MMIPSQSIEMLSILMMARMPAYGRQETTENDKERQRTTTPRTLSHQTPARAVFQRRPRLLMGHRAPPKTARPDSNTSTNPNTHTSTDGPIQTPTLPSRTRYKTYEIDTDDAESPDTLNQTLDTQNSNQPEGPKLPPTDFPPTTPRKDIA